MAIDWATIKSTIVSQVATLTGLAASRIRWVDEPSGTLAGALPVIWLRVSSVVSNGIEWETRVDNPPSNQTVTVSGLREFTLSIRCDSFSFDVADANYSGNIIEALKVRLRRSTSIMARAGVFGIRALLATNWISYIESNRPISSHTLDILCLTVDNDVDATSAAGNWIGEVTGSGPVKQQDGTTIDTPSFDAKAD